MLELIEIFLFGSNDPNLNQAFIGTAMAIGGIAKGLMGYDWGGKRKKALAAARKKYEEQKDVFRNLDTSVDNAYENMTNQYEGMENTFEDLTVNQQQAQFEGQQFAQSQANILSGLRGAAGSSGVAALAQSLAQQGQLRAQQASASIGTQEATNQRLAAQQASSLQMQERQGEIISRQQQRDQQGTLLGMSQQEVAAARQAGMGYENQAAQYTSGMMNTLGDTVNYFGGIDNITDKIKGK